MKVLLVGNYLNSRQQSMQRFSEMMERALTAAGLQVRQVRPPIVFGRLRAGDSGIAKWLGYVDRFLLFPVFLYFAARSADIVHICDQANAMYARILGRQRSVVTCHDVMAIRVALGEIADVHVGATGKALQKLVRSGIATTGAVACVSEQTMVELVGSCNVRNSLVSCVPNALNYPYSPMSQSESGPYLRGLGLAECSFFLHVGGNQWYKNRAGVLEIFYHLSSDPHYADHRLVMAGKQFTDEMRTVIAGLGIVNKVVELHDVTNEELRALYSRAEALLFPSLSEGFGWPIAEAQACGCPVATTRRPPMTEVGGGAAIYIDPAEPREAASIIAAALSSRARISAAGLLNAQRFSVDAMTTGYLMVYRSLKGLQN